MTRVAVIGGGIAGLSAALQLQKLARQRRLPLELTVLEASERLGGNVGTSLEGGFLFEHGPSAFLGPPDATRRLLSRLGLEGSLVHANESARRRYVVHRGRLEALPRGPGGLFTSPLMGARAKLRLLAEPFAKKGGAEDESVAAFAARRFGPELVDTLVDAAVAGVFAGDPWALSLQSGFPALHRLEQEHGSVFVGLIRGGRSRRGPTRLCSFAHGLATLFEAFRRELGDSIRTGARATALTKSDDGTFRIGIRESDALVVDQVVIATPARAASGLVGGLSAPLSEALGRVVSAASLCVLALGYRREQVAHPLDGFGFVVSRRESPNLLGCLWESSAFDGRAPDGFVLVKALLGGVRAPSVVHLADEEVVRLGVDALAPLLGIRGEAVVKKLFRHREAIPQYRVGHGAELERIERAVAAVPGLHLGGSAYRGVGINACIEDAEALALRVVDAMGGALSKSASTPSTCLSSA